MFEDIIILLDKYCPGQDCSVQTEQVNYIGNHVLLGWFIAKGTTHEKYSLQDLLYVFDNKVDLVREYVHSLTVVYH